METQLSSLRILVLEPDGTRAELYRAALAAGGDEVFVAYELAGALELEATVRVDVVLIGNLGTAQSVLSSLDALRRQERHRPIPAILVCPLTVDLVRGIGALDYVVLS